MTSAPGASSRGADPVRIVTQSVMHFQHAAVTRNEAAQHVRVRVVNVVDVLRRTRGLHFVASDEHAHAGLPNGAHMVQAQGRHEPQILWTQTSADAKGDRSCLQVLSAMADVLAWSHGSSNDDLPVGLRGVLGRNHRVDAFGDGRTGHDPHGRTRR